MCEPSGVFGEGGGRKTVSTKEARKKEAEADKAGGRPWRTTVVVRRRGEMSLPTALRLEYEGGGGQTITLLEREYEGASVEQAGVLAGSKASEPWVGRWEPYRSNLYRLALLPQHLCPLFTGRSTLGAYSPAGGTVFTSRMISLDLRVF